MKCLEAKPFFIFFIQYYLFYNIQAKHNYTQLLLYYLWGGVQLYLSPQTVHTLNMLNCEKYIIIAKVYWPM